MKASNHVSLGLAASLFLAPQLASAQKHVARAGHPAHVVVRGHVVQERVPQATRVEFPSFTVTVPEHWSFQGMVEPKPVGEDEMTIDFITAPGDLRKSRIYVGVRERASRMTMAQRRKHLATKKGHRFRTVSWNGLNWILDEFRGRRPHTTAWSAYIVRSGKEYLILAESPNKKRPRFEPLIKSVMRSVKFSSHPAATRSH